MFNLTIRLVALGAFLVALVAVPAVTPVRAAGGGPGGEDPFSSSSGKPSVPPPSYPKRSNTKPPQKTKKPNNQSSIGDPALAAAYRAAYATIYERNDYADAIAQLKALQRDDNPNVANLIGYSYRKLGDYKLSQVWYERALRVDPNHVLTWQYYGLWQLEQGNREQAMYHLNRIAAIRGTGCDEYKSLAAALDKPAGAVLVY